MTAPFYAPAYPDERDRERECEERGERAEQRARDHKEAEMSKPVIERIREAVSYLADCAERREYAKASKAKREVFALLDPAALLAELEREAWHHYTEAPPKPDMYYCILVSGEREHVGYYGGKWTRAISHWRVKPEKPAGPAATKEGPR